MITYIPYGIIVLLCIIMFLQGLVHRLERKDLYNRIMSKSFAEYKGGVPRSAESAHRRILRRWRGRGKGGESE